MQSTHPTTSRGKQRPSSWALLTFTILCSLLWLVFFVFVFAGVMPENPIYLKAHIDFSKPRRYMPQGWAFFTRNPREVSAWAYKISDTMQLYKPVSTSWENRFGLSNLVKSRNMESAYLLSKISNKQWSNCKNKPDKACLSNLELSGTIKNVYPKPFFCGEIGFVLHTPIPWAWSRESNSVRMPISAVKVNAQC